MTEEIDWMELAVDPSHATMTMSRWSGCDKRSTANCDPKCGLDLDLNYFQTTRKSRATRQREAQAPRWMPL